MFKRNILQFVALLSLFAVGTMAVKLVGETVPLESHTLWETLAPLPAEAAGTIYVDASASGAGTGASWTDAYPMLQDALAAAASGDQIWVAADVYYPDEGGGMTNDDRTATFTLKGGVEVYGGFAGGEASVTQRDWGINVTVLSGDIDQNGLTGGNAFHVLSGGGTDSSAVLDGFTITGGRANGSISSQKEGAGMVNITSSPTLSNLIFTGNLSETFGGGMYNDNSSPTLESITFSGNDSGSSGGAIRNSSSSPVLRNTIFSGNKSMMGGGMYNDNSNPILTNVTFSGNWAQFGSGGGIYNSTSSPTLTSTILWNNQAGTSGNQIHNVTSTPAIAFSNIQGSGGSGLGWDTGLGTDGGNNIDDDPLFVTPIDPTTAPTTAGDLRLQSGSPVIDTGDNVSCPSVDLDGYSRPIDGDLDGSAVCDMGAFEKLIDLFLPLIMR